MVEHTNFFKQWSKSDELELELRQAMIEAMTRYPNVIVVRIHDSVTLEGYPEECQSFLDTVKELTNA